MEVLVVGAGAMGRWVGATVDAAVAFADVDCRTARDAAAAVGGRTVALDGDERFDAVCVAVPIGAATEAIADQAPRAERAIVDVTGAMADPVAAMAEHAPDRERASLHPLFAPDSAPGNVAVVADARGPTVEALLEDLAAAGNRIVETTPEEHDRAMETVQARTHAAVLAFALAAEPVPDGFETPVYEGLADLAAAVTGNHPRVYADIQTTFDGAGSVAAAAAEIAAADAEAFERLYERAGRAGGRTESPAESETGRGDSNGRDGSGATTGDSGR